MAQKTFGVVLAKLWRNHDKQVNEQENKTKYCKEKAQIHEEKDKKEVIDLCGESQTTTSDQWKVEQKKNQENHNKKESKTVTRKVNKNRPEKDFQAPETIRDEVAMMCQENIEEFFKEKPNRETSGQDERPDNDEKNKNMTKPKKDMLIVH